MLTGETIIEKYVEGWIATRSLVRSPATWMPLAVVALFKAALLAAMYYFWHPWLSGFMMPAMQSVFGERAVHFPGHVMLLGDMYRSVDIVITAALGFPLIGSSLLRMAGTLRKERISAQQCMVRIFLLAPALFVLLTLFVLAWKALPMVVSEVNASIESPRRQMLVVLFGLGVSLTLEGILLYAPVYLVLRVARVVAAIGKSVRRAREWAWLTGMIVVTGWVIQAPFAYMSARSGRLLESVGADFVFVVLLASVFFELVAIFYMFASATSLVVGYSSEHHDRD